MFTFFFFFNDTATTEIYTLSLHDALPILLGLVGTALSGIAAAEKELTYLGAWVGVIGTLGGIVVAHVAGSRRSEEHTSELQSQSNLVCRLLLEKKKTQHTYCPYGNQYTQS